MFSLNEQYLETQTIPLTMISNTLRKLGQYQGRQDLLQLQRPQLIKTLKEIAIIQSSESSNRIEGINVDPKRLEKILSQKIKPKDSEKGSKTAWILEIIDALPTEFSIGDVVKLSHGISRPMIRHVLESFRKDGKLISLGTGRSAKWQKL